MGVYNLGERGQQVTQCSRSRGRKGTISCDTSDEQNLAQSEDGGSAPEELEPQDVQKGFRLEGRVGAKRAVEGAQGGAVGEEAAAAGEMAAGIEDESGHGGYHPLGPLLL